VARTAACGFDGIAIYDNYVRPISWRGHAEACSARNLVFAFNVNPGFDGVVERYVAADSCYKAPPLEPAATALDWTMPSVRTDVSRASEERIRESFAKTIELQTDPQLANVQRGFFLVYLNSFNEWHEGHQFEPMKDRKAMTAAEQAVGYHNPDDGQYRLNTLGKLIAPIVRPR
jgi:hypothetical protein